jgi:hypothetical protein
MSGATLAVPHRRREMQRGAREAEKENGPEKETGHRLDAPLQMPFTRAPRYSGESLPSAARTTRERRSRRRGGSVVPPPANRRRADYFLLAAFFFAGFLAAVFFFAGAFFAVLRAALANVLLLIRK